MNTRTILLEGYYAKTGEWWDEIEVRATQDNNGVWHINPEDYLWICWDMRFINKVIFPPRGKEVDGIPRTGFRQYVDDPRDIGDGIPDYDITEMMTENNEEDQN